MSARYKAMILAAGLGQRMQPLTTYSPKPLLKVGNKALIEYHLERLKRLGVEEVVINVSYLADRIIGFLGQGERYGLKIEYSIEDGGPLGIIGGLRQALPLLGQKPFLLFSADIWFNGPLPKALLADDSRSHLVLTAQSNLGAFFSLSEDGTLSVDGDLKDYAGIAKFHPKHIEERETDRFSRMITELIDQKQIRGSYLQGDWFNVGTPEDLRYLNGAVNNLALFKEGLDD